MCPDDPRPTGLVRYPRHKERRPTICQDEWRAWRHRGRVVLGGGDAEGVRPIPLPCLLPGSLQSRPQPRPL